MRERRSRSSNAWRDWPLARKLALLTTFMLLAVLAVTAAQLAASRQLGHALADRELGRREFTLLRDLERGLYSVQTGQRGYLLSGDAAFLAPYTSGRQGIEAALESLEGLGRHAAEARDLRRLASGYVDGWVAPSLRRYRPGDLSAGEQREIASEGKSRLDAVLAGLEAVTSQVDEDFAAARAASEVAAATLTWLPLASLAFLSLAFTGLRYGLGRFVTQPITRLRDATERLAAGDYAARVPVESNDEIGQLAGTFNATAAAIEHSNAALRERTRDLERSNLELEQFAYVASHDLQEPLRMVSSYTQLLAKRYQGKLDGRADQYIAFAVDGAQRMQRLIQDLLTFSRVGTRGGDLVPTDPDEVLDEVLRSLRLAVAEANAEIRREPLPAVLADRTQLAQLLQNLLSNAIKFRREGVPPRVEVSARPEGGMVRFNISDNGIGVDSQYFDRIFVIFQRLHGKEEFGGSGIGLAVCKKIVERHGGRIWMDSRPGEGSTFHFTLRAAEAPQGAE